MTTEEEVSKLEFKRLRHNAWKRDYRKNLTSEQRERKRLQKKQYYDKNREKIRLKSKIYYHSQIDEINHKKKEYHIKYRDRINERVRNYYRLHPEAQKARHEKFMKLHPNYYKERSRERRMIRRLRLMDILNQHKCVKCGLIDRRALQFDHINGRGIQDTKERFNGRPDNALRFYLTHPEEAKKDLQVLCANCNQIKKWDNNELGMYAVIKN